MKITFKIPFLVFFVFVISLKQSVAGVTTTSTILQGGTTLVNNATLSVDDVEYTNMVANPLTWQNNFYNKKITNRVLLKFEDTNRDVYTQSWSIQVDFDLKLYHENIPSFSTVQGSITIEYYPGVGVSYTDKSMYVTSGGVRAEISNIQITKTGIANIPGDVYLENEIEVERYYFFNQSAVSGIGHTVNPADNTVCFNWNYIPGAEEYELEWVFSSQYVTTPIDWSKATRVTTTDQHYKINMVYDNGSLTYRFRGIGRMGSGNSFDRVKEGIWNEALILFPVANIDDDRNWQYTASYGEEGKRKEVLSFFDGSLRSRQAVTLNNSDNTALITETVYDYEGRAGIQTLPAPNNIREAQLKFYSAYGLNQAGSGLYTRKDFDGDDFFTGCTPAPPNGMSNQQGASNYYSLANNDKSGFNAAIPNAQHNPSLLVDYGYPFSQTRFGTDGRVQAQSGVGLNHTIGSGHETQYFYATPSPHKLDRLFGNDVGFANHYSQKAVMDANGQISISYENLSGKVIATSLACNSPGCVNALPNTSAPTTFTDDLIVFNKPMQSDPGMEASTRYFVCNTTTPYTFEYNLTRELYTTLCASSQCVYDLHIRVKDDCDQVVMDNSIPASLPADYFTVVGPNPQLPTQSYLFSFSITFPRVGTYSIEKTLTLNQAALQQAVASYSAAITNPNSPEGCYIPPPSASEIEQTIDHTECDGCEAYWNIHWNDPGLPDYSSAAAAIAAECEPVVEENYCDVLYDHMVDDMSPEGQYFDNQISTNIDAWLNDYVWDNSCAQCWTDAGFGAGITSWATLRANWQPSFATKQFNTPIALWVPSYNTQNQQERLCNSLVEFHPEYCAFEWCEETETAVKFDASLFGGAVIPSNPNSVLPSPPTKDTYNWATTHPTVATPYVDVTQVACSVGVNMVNTYDPYFASIATASEKTAMFAFLCDVDGAGSLGDAWTEAGNNALLQGCTSLPCDKQWQIFRSMYLSKKHELMKEHKKAVNHCYAPCDQSSPADNKGDGCITIVPCFPTPCNDNDVKTYVNASTNGFMIREPDNITYMQFLQANSTSNPPAYSTANPSPYSICKKAAEATFEITSMGCGPYEVLASASIIASSGNPPFPAGVTSVDITGGLCCLPPQPASIALLVQQLVKAVNDFNSVPDFTASVHPTNNNKFIIYAPSSFGSDGNSISLTLNLPYCSSSPDPAQTMHSGNNTGPCPVVVNCLCIELDQLRDAYNAGVVPPVTGDYTDLYSYVAYATNNTHNIAQSDPQAVTAANVQAWLDRCDCSNNTSPLLCTPGGGDQPLTIPPLVPSFLDCNPKEPCDDDAYEIAGYSAQVYYESQIQQAIQNFINGYTKKCFSNPDYNEAFTVTYDDKEYHYTLYYYDQAGNLVKTVPPNGVVLLTPAEVQATEDYRNGVLGSQPQGPAHSMATLYEYNTLDQVTQQITPDAGNTLFFYDLKGRIVASQNKKQAFNGQIYSYTLYDGQGRIKEVGEVSPGGPAITQAIAEDPVQFAAALAASVPHKQVTKTYYDVPAYTPPLSQENLRQRVVSTTIEETDDNIASTYDHATHYSYDVHGNVKELVQENQQLATAASSYWLASERYKNIKYKYDLINGNVNAVDYQDGQADNFHHRYFYDADNRLAHVETAIFSHLGVGGGIWDRDAKYFYNMHGPLARTELGDKLVQGMDYAYTIQGWIKGVNADRLADPVDASNYLASSDLGRDGVKETIASGYYMPTSQNIHNNFATDAMGYTLGYYFDAANPTVNDWIPIGTLAGAVSSHAQLPAAVTNPVFNLFNGNIKNMSTALLKPNGTSLPVPIPIMANSYRYDQLHRLNSMDSWQSSNTRNYAAATNTNDYYNSFTYDRNGNIVSQLRNGVTGGPQQSMDNLGYHYYLNDNVTTYNPSTVPVPFNATNRLAYVTDAVTNSPFTDDIEDQSLLVNALDNSRNYAYDEIGNLRQDLQEGIKNIEWTVYGKISKITRFSQLDPNPSDKSDLEFKYDASGNRILKITKPRSSLGVLSNQEEWTYTYYVRDAQGNILSTYDRHCTGASSPFNEYFSQKELNIYGSSRLGIVNRDYMIQHTTLTPSGYSNNEFVITAGNYVVQPPPQINIHGRSRTLGNKMYELSNHLGNVLITVSDKKLPVDYNTYNAQGVLTASVPDGKADFYFADVASTSDYYPFGSQMPGRSFNSTDYKYGFGGKEKDDEVKGSGNSYDFGARIYDPRVGRWLACDPLSVKYPYLSPYNYVANSPLILIDPDGNVIEGVTYNKKTGSYEFSEIALKRGTDKYVMARLQTKSGTRAINRLIRDQRTFKVTVTDEILVGQVKNKDGTVGYSTTDGQTMPGQYMIFSTNIKGTETLMKEGNPDDDISVMTIDAATGDLVRKTIKRSELQKVYGDDATKYKRQYNAALKAAVAKEGGMIDPNEYEPQDDRERLNEVGAHEETHLLEKFPKIISTFRSEFRSFINQIKAIRDYNKEVYKKDADALPDVPEKKEGLKGGSPR